MFEFIGEQDAMEAFRVAERRCGGTTSQRMKRAMSDVVDSASVRSVGGFVVRACALSNSVFRYYTMTTLDLGPNRNASTNGGLVLDAQVEGAEYRCFGVESDDGYPAVGFWFDRLGHGWVLAPLDSSHQQRVDATDPTEFANRVSRLVGRPMTEAQDTYVRADLPGG